MVSVIVVYDLAEFVVTKSVKVEKETPLLIISGSLVSTFGISEDVFLVLRLPEVNLEYCRYENDVAFFAV